MRAESKPAWALLLSSTSVKPWVEFDLGWDLGWDLTWELVLGSTRAKPWSGVGQGMEPLGERVVPGFRWRKAGRAGRAGSRAGSANVD